MREDEGKHPTPQGRSTTLTLALLGVLAGVALGCMPAASAALPAVSTSAPTPVPTEIPTVPAATPLPTDTPLPTVTPLPSPTPAPLGVYVPPELPAGLGDVLGAVFTAHPAQFSPVTGTDAAEVELVPNAGPGDGVVAEWVYAVVAPFPTLVDEVAWADVTGTWAGTPSGPFAGRPLLVTPDTAAVLALALGQPAPGAVEIVPDGEIVQRAWDSRPGWAVVPFDRLEPRWKVLRLDGQSVLDRDMDASSYPLVVRVGVRGTASGVSALREVVGPNMTNRDPRELAVVMMTGVTALTRGTAMRMDTYGPDYPGQDIRPWLIEPDITHISSEVSFAADCPPQTSYTTLIFCSDPAYVGLLDGLDIDVIELTGNHLLDWGVEAMKLSLQMYDDRSIPYFGGGWDLTQARTPVTLTVGTQTFGFAGCNPAGPQSDWATDERPGSAPCDYEQLYAQIGDMRAQGIIPIVTLQYREYDQTEPTPQQRVDFRALAEAGAAIVSGSQAHQPQGFDFHAGAFIHYGLGNLFFDQMWSLETRQEFLDRHVFYAGRHISTEVLTAILEDYSRPRPMSVSERQELLQAAFTASGW